ncbi:MAG: hypothetical protein HQL88_02040 [Magnetococcales bacterium]|nr:hypothetical protein [Magnetococcales bacterium]
MGITIPTGTLAASTARINGRFFAAALFLCVTLLVGVGAASLFLHEALTLNARQLLAADLRLQATLVIPPPGTLPPTLSTFAEQHIAGHGRHLSPSLEFRAMARVAGSERTTLVEVKAVAADYPLRGQLHLDNGASLPAVLSQGGVVVEKTLLSRLGLRVGDTLWVGDAPLTIAATLAHEPDRITHLFSLGPRLIMALQQVPETGLLQTGSRVTQILSVRLREGEKATEVAETLRAAATTAGIRLITPEQSQPSVRRFVRRFALFTGLTALLTLLVGGVAMTAAMGAYLHDSRATLAILKVLGAENRQIMTLVVGSLLRLAWPAALAGGISGILLPALLPPLLPGLFPEGALYQPSLWLAGAGMVMGLLFSLLCAIGPLWWSRSLSPAHLFRTTDWREALQPTGPGGWMGVWALLTVIASALGVTAWSGEAQFGWLFAAGLLVLILVTWGMARALLGGLGRLSPRRYYWRLAIRTLLRRGEPYGTLLMALGAGLGLVAALLFLEDALHQQLVSRVPLRMPSFFFIDIQEDQRATFQEIAQQYAAPYPDAIRLFPTVRGRLLGGVGVTDDPDQPQSWRKAREYVLTRTATLPAGNRLLAGNWWSSPTAQEASVEVEMAKALGLGVGDRVTFDIQGHPVSATVANLREVRWSDLGINFFVIFSPAVLQETPGVSWNHLASVVAPVEQEAALLMAMNDRLHNVTAVATRSVLESVQALLQQLARAARFLGGGAVVAGLLLLGVSVAASRRRRRHAIALYRLIGSSRAEVTRIVAAEFALLGLLAALIGVIIGHLVTALVIEGLLRDLWHFNPWLTLATFVGGSTLLFATGLIGSYRESSEPVMALLRRTGGG